MTEAPGESPEVTEPTVDLFAEETPESEAPAAPEPAPEPETPAFEVPEKYRGKTFEEVVAMDMESQRFAGQRGSEIGELRSMVDSIAKAQLTTQQAAAPAPAEPEEEINYFEDPKAAIDKAIENHPDVLAAKETSAASARQAATQRLAAKHPDMNEIVADQAFLAWVQESPIRTRLFQSAHHRFDTDAADELFSNWKERKQLAVASDKVEERAREQVLQDAGVTSTPGSSAQAPVKKYRRADIIRLMTENPTKYASMADEFLLAYDEGRVI